MGCNGTTTVGVVADDLGTIRYVFCDACRTIAVDAWDARRRRRSWGIAYLDPETVGTRFPAGRPRSGLDALRRGFGLPGAK